MICTGLTSGKECIVELVRPPCVTPISRLTNRFTPSPVLLLLPLSFTLQDNTLQACLQCSKLCMGIRTSSKLKLFQDLNWLKSNYILVASVILLSNPFTIQRAAGNLVSVSKFHKYHSEIICKPYFWPMAPNLILVAGPPTIRGPDVYQG